MYTEKWEEYLENPSPLLNKLEVWADLVKDPSPWIFSAKINHEIADLVYKKYENATKYDGHVIMLYGLAVECYLKANALRDGMDPIDKDGVKLDDKFKNHNLIVFYKFLFGSINSEIESYLERLSRGIKSGKYPFETTPSKNNYKKDIDKMVLFCKKLIKKLEIKN